MQRALLVALLIAAGCASGGSTPRRLSIDVTEGSGGRRTTEFRTHNYSVRLRNISQGPINIESIQLDPVGAEQFDVEGGSLSIGETIAPGEDRTYQLSVTVMPWRGGGIVAQTQALAQAPDLSSLRVSISCSDEGGTFLVDETVNVGRGV